MDLDRHETARRIRALWGYSLLSQNEFAALISPDGEARTGRRYMRTTGPTRSPEAVLTKAAVVAGLPDHFALGEFGVPAATDPELQVQVTEMERRLRQLEAGGGR